MCHDAWKAAFTQSLFYVGAIFGTLFFGWASDHYGRYWSFVASNMINLVTGIATPFAFDFISFVIIRFLMGLGFITFFMSLYMLSMCLLLSGTFFRQIAQPQPISCSVGVCIQGKAILGRQLEPCPCHVFGRVLSALASQASGRLEDLSPHSIRANCANTPRPLVRTPSHQQRQVNFDERAVTAAPAVHAKQLHLISISKY